MLGGNDLIASLDLVFHSRRGLGLIEVDEIRSFYDSICPFALTDDGRLKPVLARSVKHLFVRFNLLLYFYLCCDWRLCDVW